MHFYPFNIGDYATATAHLEPLEDIAYRRLMDLYYSTEKPIPECLDKTARLIRMRTHSDCIAIVLEEFFTLEDDGHHCDRIDVELFKFHEKSEKASKSAKARWKKAKKKQKVTASCEGNANALKTHSEGNAKQELRTNKQETVLTPLVQPKVKPKKAKFNAYHLDFSKWMFSLVLKLNPNNKQPNFETWANTIRLMMESDKRDGDHMVKVFTWANNDSFWCSNILSPTKLRDKYDDLVVKMNNGGSNQAPTERTQEQADQFVDELEDQFARSQAAKQRREARGNKL